MQNTSLPTSLERVSHGDGSRATGHKDLRVTRRPSAVTSFYDPTFFNSAVNRASDLRASNVGSIFSQTIDSERSL